MRSYLYAGAEGVTVLADAAPDVPGGWVRLPAGAAAERAVRSVVGPGLTGVCPSAARSVTELAALGAALAEAEEAAGLPVGHVAVMPAVETAAGVLAAVELARAPRVVRLLLGEAGLCRELRLAPGPDERELLWVRSMVVAASAAAGIAPPLADVCPDPARFAGSTEALRRLGFGGRLCADEVQLELAAGIFAAACTLSPEDIS